MEDELREAPFPEGPEDNDVFYHGEIVCQYHSSNNTWECRRVPT